VKPGRIIVLSIQGPAAAQYEPDSTIQSVASI
jgi:hypothetical protein